MQAIILAAGMGKRLKELTRNNTKCMVKVNGISLIERMLRQIERHHLSRIVIVVGYEGKKLIDYIGTLGIKTPIVYIQNPVYDKTNNIYSLSLAKEWLCKEDTLLFESDIIFDDAVLDLLMSDPRETLALVDKYEAWMDGTCVKLTEDDRIEAFVPGKKIKFQEINEYYKTVNIYKFSAHFSKTHYVPFLDAYQSALGQNEYYEQVLRVITMLDDPKIKAKRLDGQNWYEIDDIQDLDIAESIFAPNDDEKVKLLQARNGGYWRYPKLLDLSRPVNPYFPTDKMKDELRANFDTLLTEYPSGVRVNSLLAAKNFGIHQENILAGGGAEELIRSLMGILNGKTGYIGPTSDEYLHQYDRENLVVYIPQDLTYTANDLIDCFSGSEIRDLILADPNGITGSYIKRPELLRLISWTKENDIKLLIDESFADLADEENSPLLEQVFLQANPHLYVLKDIGASYGAAGLRLSILASGDTETIEHMKKDPAARNINSFAEFFMQILEKYKSDHSESLARIKKERDRLEKSLSGIDGIRVIPSQAYFVIFELKKEIPAKELLKALLIKHDLLLKELAVRSSSGNYLAAAIRNEEDNNKLIYALKCELGINKD